MSGMFIVAEHLPQDPISFRVCFYADLKVPDESAMQQ